MPSTHEQPWVLGISASHNGAVCLLHGDEIVVAIQEERLSRFKRHRLYGRGPSLAAKYCLEYAGLNPADLDLVVLCVQGRLQDEVHDIYGDPFLNLRAHGTRMLTIPHHYGHAFSAFATSGFEESAILIIDGAGSPDSDFTAAERQLVNGDFSDAWETISLYYGSGTSIVPLEKHAVDRGAWFVPYEGEMPLFGSLGGMFSAAAEQIFGEAMDAGKVMGLASYAEPAFPASDFFDIDRRRFHFKDTVPLRFRHDRRWPNEAREYEALAASVQAALEVALLYLVQRLRELCRSDNLCYAGGVALNSVANERLIRESGYKNVYIMPAAEDSGPAVGAAYHGLWQLTKHNSRRRLSHDALGRTYSAADITAALNNGHQVRVVHSTDVISDAVDLLCNGKIIGWFDLGAELGPRALLSSGLDCCVFEDRIVLKKDV